MLLWGGIKSGNALMVLTNDADIPILVGDCCIAIKQYSKSGLTELVSTCQKVIHRLAQILLNVSSQQKSNKIVGFTKYFLFDRVTYQKIRALMILFLCCDVFVKGMATVGVKSLQDLIQKEYLKFQQCLPQTNLYGYLKHNLCKHTNRFDEEI